jgi:hypothetical protein
MTFFRIGLGAFELYKVRQTSEGLIGFQAPQSRIHPVFWAPHIERRV